MGIKKEFICLAHGPFEAESALCPKGCTTAVERHFRTAPALKSPRTSNIDRTLQTLARDFGYSDLNNRNGAVAGGKGNPKAAPDFRPSWKEVPKGDVQLAGGKVEKRDGSQGGAVAATKAERVAPNAGEVGFSDISKKFGQPRPLVEKKLVYGGPADLAAAVKSVA